MFCPGCGFELAEADAFCGRCGKGKTSVAERTVTVGGLVDYFRHTHPFTKFVAFCFAAVIVAAFIGIASIGGNQTGTPSAPANKDSPAATVDPYVSAIGACELWAGKNAPGVQRGWFGLPDDIIEDYRLPRRKKDRPELYRVGFRYRSAGAKLLMHAECAVLVEGGTDRILDARAGIY